MNKTIIINMNGIIFHIEEDAYEILKSYMIAVKRHFAYTPGSEEIVTDIENRIAEMFSERLALEKKQVVVLTDVQEVTAQMGSVNDFAAEEDDSPYTDPTQPKLEKKLYRDADDRVIGGVCAGVGHYFDIEPKWVRLFIGLSIILGGAGLWIYLILWIVMPRARTRTEKMAMKGEQINLQNFKKNFDEEVEALKTNFSKAHQEAKPALNNLGDFLSDVFENLGSFLKSFIKIIIKVVCVFIIIDGIIALLALGGSLVFVNGFLNSSEINGFPLNAINPEYRSPIYFSAFVLIVIPIVALILFALRILINRKVVTKSGSFAMLILWLTGLGVGIYYGSRLASEFVEEATFSQSIDIKPQSIYYLNLNESKFLTKEDSIKYGINNKNRRITINGRNFNNTNLDHVRLFIERSDVDQPTLVQEFSAQGPDFGTALKSARQTNYAFSQKDSTLEFNHNIHINDGQLWRTQRLRLTLFVPLNTKLIIDGRLDNILQDQNLYDCRPEDSRWEEPTEWIMTETGLKCTNAALFNKNTEDN